jgi:rhodanese-related sulfurtransferase
MQKETVDTLGNQKKTNYALNQPDKESFVREVLDGLSAPPKYFGMNVAMNKGGIASFDEVMKNGNKPVSVEDFEQIAEDSGALILDTRDANVFHKGFIPNSINIGLKGDFAPWVGAMIVDVQQPILLVADLGTEVEVITRLSRVGFDHVIGYLNGGFQSWENSGKEIDSVNRISAEEFAKRYNENSIVFDVRKESEYEAEHVNNSYLRPLADINEWANSLDNKEHFFVHCAGGYRSMIASSILNSRGIRNFTEVEGGFNKIKETSVPKANFMCKNKTL